MMLSPLSSGQTVDAILAQGHSLFSREARWLYWFRMACDAAMLSSCKQARCGAVLVGPPSFSFASQTVLFGGSLLSNGWNGPPNNSGGNCRCGLTLPSRRHPKADRTCCMHAEARALFKAPRDRLAGSTLFFARVDERGNLLPSGRPYCTGCSKLALDVGIGTWALWHENGPREYLGFQYNELSHEYDDLMDREEAEREVRTEGGSSFS